MNVGGSTGSAGLDTNLAPSMTIGTGFFGRSRSARTWSRGTWSTGRESPTPATRPMRSPTFAGLEPWSTSAEATTVAVPDRAARRLDAPREEIRRAPVEELRELMKR